MNTSEQKNPIDDLSWHLFSEYRAVLKQFLLYHMVDEGRLPIDKQTLKSVIKLLMVKQWGEDEMNGLRNAYVWLSKFQPDAGPVEKNQEMNMQFYEDCLERDGVKLNEMERRARLLSSAKGALNHDELKVIEDEKRMLETELAGWERTNLS